MNDSQVLEDLAYLKRVVQDSRRVVVDNGVQLLSWGILIVFGMIATYAYVHLGLNLPETWMWIILIGIGWGLSIWLGWIKMKRSHAITFIQKVLSSIWIGLGVTMTIIGFLGPVTGAISPWATVPLLSLILGSGFLATGTVHQERLLILAAVGWWAGGLITMFWPGDYTLLLFAGMMILFQIVPGIFVYRKWKKQMGSSF